MKCFFPFISFPSLFVFHLSLPLKLLDVQNIEDWLPDGVNDVLMQLSDFTPGKVLSFDPFISPLKRQAEGWVDEAVPIIDIR